jgi:putative membrane protein
MYWYAGHMGNVGWGWVVGLAVLIAAVVLLIWAVTSMTRAAGSSKDAPHRTEALDILRARFARGEITKEEFEDAKRTLGYGP